MAPLLTQLVAPTYLFIIEWISVMPLLLPYLSTNLYIFICENFTENKSDYQYLLNYLKQKCKMNYQVMILKQAKL